MKEFRVRKILTDGTLKIEYKGILKERNNELISIDTGWSREPLDLGYVIFEPDDHWVETFYLNKWYNVFRISSKEGILKGFYINISKPPIIKEDLITWEDLALDVWVPAEGEFIVLDEDEFLELGIDEDTKNRALKALEEVKDLLGSGVKKLNSMIS